MEALAIVIAVLVAVYFWRITLPIALIIGVVVLAQDAHYNSAAEVAKRAKEQQQADLYLAKREAAEAELRAEKQRLRKHWQGMVRPDNGAVSYVGPFEVYQRIDCQLAVQRAAKAAGGGSGTCALIDPDRQGGPRAKEVARFELDNGEWYAPKAGTY